jgi:hypothetical protein
MYVCPLPALPIKAIRYLQMRHPQTKKHRQQMQLSNVKKKKFLFTKQQ